jgi:serine/threonine protein kinase
VKLVKNIHNNKTYAAKIINKRALEKKKKGFFKDENGSLVVNTLLQDSMREIAILKKLNHDNIIKLYEIIYDDDAGKIYLILECCSKGPILHTDEFTGEFSINKHYKNEENNKEDYSEDEIKDFVRGIISGLHYLHLNNVIHRDLKPDNILLDADFKTKLTDFNVSAMLESDKNDKVGKKIEGTVYFMAPECCEGMIVI